MAKNKTTETTASVKDFINAVTDEQKRTDSLRLKEILEDETGFEAKMWGPAIVGYGAYHYKYDSGHEGDAPLAAFSPRANAISLYLYMAPGERTALLEKLGRHKAAKGCIYIKKLQDIDEKILREMISASVVYLRNKR